MDTIIAAPAAVRYVLWGRKGIFLTELMAPGTTITSEVYCKTLNKLRSLIQRQRRGMRTKDVHDNALSPHRGSDKCFTQALQLGDFRPPLTIRT